MSAVVPEAEKLRKHLDLLREQYSQLQDRYDELRRKCDQMPSSDSEPTTYISRVLMVLEKLYDSEQYSDLIIKSRGREFKAHKIVLSARSDRWADLSETETLDWSEIDSEIAEVILKWVYTDRITALSDDLTLSLIIKAEEFKLDGLVRKCEEILIGNVTPKTCVKLYSVAEEVNALKLREYCSGLISTYWDEFEASDFEHMSGPLLYKMLKGKSTLPLHSAVRLGREDVVFLCLVENSSKLSDIVNLWDANGDLPLDLALRARNSSLASTLIQHNADVNIRDSAGDALIHRAIKSDDHFSAAFLLDNNCDATVTTRSENDTSLHLLSASNSMADSVKIAEKLINRNVNINAQNRQGFTALHIAITSDNRPIFDVLLAKPSLELDLRNDRNRTPIYYALRKYESDNAYYVENLSSRGAELNPLDPETGNNLTQVLIKEKYKKSASLLTSKLASDVDLDHRNSAGETALHLAALNDYPELVRDLLRAGADGNLTTNDANETCLHYAVEGGSEGSIEEVIKFNASASVGVRVDLDPRDSEGETPLGRALGTGRKELVPALIRGGADVNVRDGKDFTPLHRAILKEDSATAIFLLDHGADVNAKTAEYETPLQLAIHCRLSEVVESLCVRGVDMSAPDRLGNCALWAALDSGQDDIASILVQHGADTDCWGPGPDGCRQTLLHRAIDENKEPAAIFLIQTGCDLDSPRMPGPNGEGGDEVREKASPLHLCCQWGLEPVVQTLVEHGANVNARDSDNRTPLHSAVRHGFDSIVALLLRVPEVDLNVRDRAGLSPFAAALTHRNDRAARAILEKLPSAAEQFDSKGHNFLHTAIKKGDKESVLFLLSINVNVNSRVQDAAMTPPLHLAACHGDETLVRSLLLAGARIDDVDAHKRTALHAASESGNSSVVAALVQNNAHFDATDTNGDNALHVAVREGQFNVIKILLTESNINAEAVNIKGRNPLHELCINGKENSAAICDFFLECMPDYPINKQDVNGNTPLILAYMKGNGNLCRVLVRSKASLAIENFDKVSIFNYQVATKQLLASLLDQLSEPGPWANSSDLCQECGKGFTVMSRRHHCRHCGRLLCGRCSDQEVPIVKFNENKPVRVCRVCFDVLSVGSAAALATR